MLLVDRNDFIAEGLHSSTSLTALLGVLNQQHGQPRHRTAPFVHLFAGVGVGSTHLGKPGALDTDAVFFDQGAIGARLYLRHGLVLGGQDYVNVLHSKVQRGAGEGVVVGVH